MKKASDFCEICGSELTYLSDSGDRKLMNCHFCNRKIEVNVYCEKGHYICDDCHSKDAKQITLDFCKKTKLKDPFQIADHIMKHPKFKIYGPEHHFLVPAALLTALKNLGVRKPNGAPIEFVDIREAVKRGATIPGGYCGFYGTCGSAIGNGILISILTGATPSKGTERTLANKLTSQTLLKIADNLEHCCKRSLKYAICDALDFLNKTFKIAPPLDYSPEKCSFSELNPKCEQIKCPFH